MGTKLTKNGISFPGSENEIVSDSIIKTIYTTLSSTSGKGSFNSDSFWIESSNALGTTPRPTQLRSEDSYVWNTGSPANVFWQIAHHSGSIPQSIGIGGFGILGVKGTDGKATIKTVKIETSNKTTGWIELKTVVLPEDVHSNIHYITLDGKPGEIGYPWYVAGGYGYNNFRITFIDKYSETDNIKVKGIDIYQTSLNVAPDNGNMVNPLSNPLIYKPDENIITTGNIHTRAVYHDYDEPLHDTVEDIKSSLELTQSTINTHETEIGFTSGNYQGVVNTAYTVRGDILDLNERLERLESLDTDKGKLILVQPYTIDLRSTIWNKVYRKINTNKNVMEKTWYQLQYDDFGTSGISVPDRAILYGNIYSYSPAYNKSRVEINIRSVDEIKKKNDDNNYTDVSRTHLDNARDLYYSALSEADDAWVMDWRYFIPYIDPVYNNHGTYKFGLSQTYPRSLAFSFNTFGGSNNPVYPLVYMTLLGYMLPDYTGSLGYTQTIS